MHNQPLQIIKPSFVRIALAAILILAALPGRVMAQQSDATISDSGTTPANPFPPTAYYLNAVMGYKISGRIVLVAPGGSSTANLALGYQALLSNTTGSVNTASGSTALYHNTTGTANMANGFEAFYLNTTGNNNTASGYDALDLNTTGSYNTASGSGALYTNSTGYDNTASGVAALNSNSTGYYDTAFGFAALDYNTTGSNNIAIGYNAAINVSGRNSNNIHIGSSGTAADDGVISIGTSGTQTSSYMAGIAGVTLPTANEPLVCIDPPTGQLGTLNCATNGLPSAQQEVITQLQQQVQTQAQQIADLQQRLSRLESPSTKN